ncbi:Leu/Ile/Val-binding protein [Rhodoferax lithotrophicus]|uniref:Leu/Ile/Val-binding protein n=1 Tax=Rhodoferax lithotrophicus TaxID=2798804 RepID=A0ABM7MSM0_9BURK|nr:ABC transporter substrate-binding protein [Rhodoferax sp. MIZ03]BCO29366.1 Leu/Ile/Val-binding protein [Rhodoferax sp. MIZ03]
MKQVIQAAILSIGLISGTPLLAGDAGVTDTAILIGSTAVLTGPLGPQTTDYTIGSGLYFDAINAAGGVYGRKIIYKPLDDGFDVKRTLENTRKLLLDDKVFLIYNSTGTAHTAAILPLLTEHKTVIFGPVTGASTFRDHFNRYLFNVRASYANEAQRIVQQQLQVGLTKVAMVYQDDGFGNALMAEVKSAAESRKLDIPTFIKINPKQPDFNAAAAAIAQAQPQAVVMGTAGLTFSSFVKALNATTARPVIYGFSVVSTDMLNREMGAAARGIVLAQIMPSLRNGSVPVVQEYLRLLKAKNAQAEPSSSQFEGFIHAKVLVEGLRRGGKNLSTDSFIKGLETGGDISFGKFVAHYSPDSHSGSSYVELAIMDAAGQLRY